MQIAMQTGSFPRWNIRFRENIIFDEEQFPSFVQDDVKRINNWFRESFVRMKGHR